LFLEPRHRAGLFYLRTLTMPGKDPAFWAAVWSAIAGLSATTKGAAMATLISYLRVMYDGKETHQLRVLLEALICGCLSLCATSVISWLQLPADLAIAAGGAVGFMGVNTMRDLLLKWFGKRAAE
jgi:lambda family phage holin